MGARCTGSVHLKSPQNILSSVVCTRSFLLRSDSRNVCASAFSAMVRGFCCSSSWGRVFSRLFCYQKDEAKDTLPPCRLVLLLRAARRGECSSSLG